MQGKRGWIGITAGSPGMRDKLTETLIVFLVLVASAVAFWLFRV